MATLMHSESKRMYSWWWDSHISPKNSKWLLENLTDMDEKINAMIKLLEEDADSFAKRAEMYYKKRPELMALMEEFYRTYRALAERYDHATGALRQAHRTMAEAFPNQIPLMLPDDSPTASSSCSDVEPHTPEMPFRSFSESDDLQKETLGSSTYHDIKKNGTFSDGNQRKKGLKQLNEMFSNGEEQARTKFGEWKARKGLNFHEEEGELLEHKNSSNHQESDLQEEVSRLSTEIQNLKCQITSEAEHADKAAIEIGTLKETISQLKLEKEEALVRYHESLERISNLETKFSQTQEDLKSLNNEMAKEVINLKDAEEKCVVLKSENQCLKSNLRSLDQKTKIQQHKFDQKQGELDRLVVSLKTLEDMHAESHEKVQNLSESIQKAIQKLNSIELSNMSLAEEMHKLKEENCNLKEQALFSSQKMGNFENEISLLKEKEEKLEKEVTFHVEEKKNFQTELLHEKSVREDLEQKHKDIQEKTQSINFNFEAMQKLIKELLGENANLKVACQKQEEEKLLYLEKMRDAEKLYEKNAVLENSVSDASVELDELRKKLSALQQSCDSLNGQLSVQISEKEVLIGQLQTSGEDMKKLSESNMSLADSLSKVNTENDALEAKLRTLQESYQVLDDERSQLLCERNELLSQVKSRTLEAMKLAENRILLETSLSDKEAEVKAQEVRFKDLEKLCHSLHDEKSSLLAENKNLALQIETTTTNIEKLLKTSVNMTQQSQMDGSRELEVHSRKLTNLEGCFHFLCDENANLLVEKAKLVSQLETAAQNAEKLSERNASLEKSFYDSSAKLENLTQKLRGLEDLCQRLSDEKSDLVAEKKVLASEVETTTQNVERILEKNSFLEKSLHDATAEAEGLREKLRSIEDSCRNLSNDKFNLTAENNTLSSKVESAAHSMEKLSAENAFLEKSLLNATVELEDLRVKLRHLEDCCQTLSNEYSNVFAEKNALTSRANEAEERIGKVSKENAALELYLSDSRTELTSMRLKAERLEESYQLLSEERLLLSTRKDALISQVQKLCDNLAEMENEFSKLAEKCINLECIEILKVHKLTELVDHLRVEKDKHESIAESTKFELATLGCKLKLLMGELLVREQKLDMEQKLLFYTQNEAFIFRECMLDMTEMNVSLSSECHKHLDASSSAENLIWELNKESCAQKKMAALLTEHNEKLMEGISSWLKALNISTEQESANGIKGLLLLQLVRDEVTKLLVSSSYAHTENQQLYLEKLISFTILQQFAQDNFDLRAQRNDFEMEHLVKSKELSQLQYKWLELREDLQASNEREATLKVQMEILHEQLSTLQGAHDALQIEVCKIKEEDQALSKKVYEVLEEMGETEMQNSIILEEALTLDCQNLIFSGLCDERASQLMLLTNTTQNLCGKNDELCQEIGILNEKVAELQCENKQLKGSISALEGYKCQVYNLGLDLSAAQSQCQQLSLQIQTGNHVLMQKDLELLEVTKKVEEVEKTLQDKILQLIAEVQLLSERYHDLEGKKDKVEEECSTILTEYVALDCLSSYFKSLSSERALELMSFKDSMDCLVVQKSGLNEDLTILSEKMGALVVEKLQLSEAVNSLKHAHNTGLSEKSKLMEENKFLLKELGKLLEQTNAVNEENMAVLLEAFTMEFLYMYFRSLSSDRGMEVKLLSGDLNCLEGTKNHLEEKIRTLNERMEVSIAEKLHLKESVLHLEQELKSARSMFKEFIIQFENVKSLLVDRDKKLSDANLIIESTEMKNEREFEDLQLAVEEVKVLKEVLESNILSLIKGNEYKDEKILCLCDEKRNLEAGSTKLQREFEVLRNREKQLTSKLGNAMDEAEQCEKEIAGLLAEVHISKVDTAIFKEKALESLMEYESHLTCVFLEKQTLHEELSVQSSYVNGLTVKLDGLQGENRELKTTLATCLLLVISLRDAIASLEKHSLSLLKHHKSKLGQEDTSTQPPAPDGNHEEHTQDVGTSSESVVVSYLKKLLAKVEALQHVLISSRNFLEKERLHSNASLEDTVSQEELQAVYLSPETDTEFSKLNHALKMKDIQLDQISSSSLYGSSSHLYRLGKSKRAATEDEMLELWETAERDYNDKNKRASMSSNDKDTDYHEIKAVEEDKSEHPSSEFIAEKELGVDRLELRKLNEALKWKSLMTESLHSDAQKLSVLQTSLQELKKKMENSEREKSPLSAEYNLIKIQLKETEGAVLQLTDINNRMKKKAEEYSAVPGSLEGQKEELQRMEKMRFSERARRGSEKIESLELALQKIQYILLKLEEEREHKKKAMERRSATLLKDYISEKGENRRRKRRVFCGCIRPKTKV